MRWVAIFDDVPGADEIRREHADSHGLRAGYRLFAWGKASFYGPVEL